MISFSVKLCVLFRAFLVVKGTLTPDGPVPLDCGNKETFICNVTGVAAQWTISGLSGISVTRDNGLGVANNPRITTTDTSGATTSSTITITGFTTADNEGTIQCINLDDNSVQGMANISVATPLCPTNVNSELNDDCTSVNVTWEQPDTTPVTLTTVTYCPASSPNCGNSINCTSPCFIDGLTSTEDHNFTVIPNNNCGHATGCKMVTPVRGIPMCPGNVTISRRDNMATDVTWQQPTNTPLVTNTTVTYCLSSSPNCRNSTTCISSPCSISGLDSCQDYQFTVIPNNNCGSPTGCEMHPLSGGTPGVTVEIVRMTGQPSSANITWRQNGSFPQVTSITVTYCPASSSNCGNSMNCTTSPCPISELDHGTQYHITVTPMSICGSGMEVIKMLEPVVPAEMVNVPAIVGGVVGGVVFIAIVVVVALIIVVCVRSKSNSIKDNDRMHMSAVKTEERANLTEDTYASPGTGKPQPETTDGVYSYAATETKIGAQMKEREQQKKQPPPQGDFYEEPNAAKNMQHKAGTITGETYAQPDKPKRGTKKKDKQQKEPVPHKEVPAGDLYAMPDKKKDVSHTSGPVTGDEYAVASKPKTGGGYGAHGPQ